MDEYDEDPTDAAATPPIDTAAAPELPAEPVAAAAPDPGAAPNPTVHLSDEQAQIPGLENCTVGSEYTGTITFRVSGIQDQDGSHSKDLELLHLDNVMEAGAGGAAAAAADPDAALPGEGSPSDADAALEPPGDDIAPADLAGEAPSPDAAEESMLGYARPKSTKKAAPVDFKKLRS